MNGATHRRKEMVIGGVMMLALATVFVAVFSYNTSPLYHEWGDNTDSPIFYLIGRGWAEGQMPYRDLWDLKGPMIFLVNAIGHWLTGSLTGVFLLQVVSLAVALAGGWQMLRQSHSPLAASLLLLFSLASLSYTYAGGNLTEEYLLPWLTWALYGVGKGIKGLKGVGGHDVRWALLYGATVGLALMSRATNALALCGAVAVIAVVLMVHGQWRNLLGNIFAFLVGFALTTLPFVVYFHCRGALAEMWDGTFLHAVRYAAHATKDLQQMGWHYFVLSYLNSIVLLTMMLLTVIAEHRLRLRTAVWLMAALLPFVWFCQGNGFGNYGTTVWPLFFVILSPALSIGGKDEGAKPSTLRSALVALLLVAVTIGCGSKLRYMHHLRTTPNQQMAAIGAFVEQSPYRQGGTFAAYNCPPNVYLMLHRQPDVRFFVLQDFAIGRNERLREDVVESFGRQLPQQILLRYDPDERPAIASLLERRYRLAAHDALQHLKLYERID